jgi:hypothetical protein
MPNQEICLHCGLKGNHGFNYDICIQFLQQEINRLKPPVISKRKSIILWRLRINKTREIVGCFDTVEEALQFKFRSTKPHWIDFATKPAFLRARKYPRLRWTA